MPRRSSAEVAFVRVLDVQTRLRGSDWLVARLAGQQWGVVARGQLLELGLGREAIAGRVARGSLHRLHPGVYAVGHQALAVESRWMAAVLSVGTGAVLSHHSAARLWGLTGGAPDTIHVTAACRTRSARSIRRHFMTLPPDEVAEHRAIPATTVPRTLFDLAAAFPADRLEAAMRKAEFLRLWDQLSLPALLDRYPGHRGNATLRLCLERLGGTVGFTRSDFEELFLPFVDRFGLPRPHLNARLLVRGAWIEVDCLWREERLIVELDSRAAHETRSAFEADRDRDRRLQAEGWRVVRITWSQLHNAPAPLARDLRAMLRGTPVAWSDR